MAASLGKLGPFGLLPPELREQVYHLLASFNCPAISQLNTDFNKEWWLYRDELTITYHAFVKLCHKLPNVCKLKLRMTARSGFARFSPMETERMKSLRMPKLKSLYIARCAVESLENISVNCAAFVQANRVRDLTLPVEMASLLQPLPELESLTLLAVKDTHIPIDFVYGCTSLTYLVGERAFNANLDPARLSNLQVCDVRLLAREFVGDDLGFLNRLTEAMPFIRCLYLPFPVSAEQFTPLILDMLFSSSPRIQLLLLESFYIATSHYSDKVNGGVQLLGHVMRFGMHDQLERIMKLQVFDLKHLCGTDPLLVPSNQSAMYLAYQYRSFTALQLVRMECEKRKTWEPFLSVGHVALHEAVLGDNEEFLRFALSELRIDIDARSELGQTVLMRRLANRPTLRDIELLLKYKPDLHARCGPFTPLSIAAARAPRIFLYFAENMLLDLRHIDEETGNTVLHDAAIIGGVLSDDTIAAFKRHVPDLINTTNKRGMTPFLLEAETKNYINEAWIRTGDADPLAYGPNEGFGTVFDYFATEGANVRIAKDLVDKASERGISFLSRSKLAAGSPTYMRLIVDRSPSFFTTLLITAHNLPREELEHLLQCSAELHRSEILFQLVIKRFVTPDTEIEGYGKVSDHLNY